MVTHGYRHAEIYTICHNTQPIIKYGGSGTN
jgi:hypothetical protein